MLLNLKTTWENFRKIRNHFQVYNVQDYGADPTGVKDSTTAIQAAIAAAQALVSSGIGGAVVYLPRGRYKSGALTVSAAGITFRGDGHTATEIQTYGSGTSLIKFDLGAAPGQAPPMACRIEGFKVTWVNGTWTNLIHLKNISWFVLSDLWLEGDNTNVTHCLYSESALSYTIQHSIFRYAKDYCVNIEKTNTGVTTGGHAYPNSVKFICNEVERGGKFGVRYADGTLFQMIGGQIEGNGTGANDINHGGFLIDTCDLEAGAGLAVSIQDIHFESNSGAHIRVNKLGFAASMVSLLRCNVLGTGGPAGAALYGLYCNVTNPDRARVYADKCNFFNATAYDLYFPNDSVGIFRDVQTMTQSLNKKCTATPWPNNGSFSQTDLGPISYQPQEFNAGETTPTCNYVSPFKYFNNSAATTVTQFLGCGDGAYLLAYSPNTNTTIKHRSSGVAGATDEIDCPGGVDYRLSAGESVMFFRLNNHWYPMGFGGPFNGPATFNKAVSVAGNLNISDHIIFTSKTLNLRYDTSTGANDARLCLTAGNADAGVVANGAYLDLRGTTNGVPGVARLAAGNVAGGKVILATGNDVPGVTVNEDQTVDFANDLKLASGKVLKINGTQVLTGQQTGMGASLSSRTAGATYGATEQTMLQEAHDKIRLLEAKLKTHGIVAT